MNRKWGFLILGAIVLVGGCRSSGALREFETAPLYGMVYDAHNQPCSSARIIVDEQPGPTTDINGRFVLPELAHGVHQIVVAKSDYETATVEVDFVDRTQVLYVKVSSLSQLVERAEDALEGRRDGEALELVERALVVRDTDPTARYLKAVTLFRLDQGEQAQAELEQMLADGLRAPAIYLLLADVYEHALANPAAAAGHLETYLRLIDDPEARDRLGRLRE